jgi:hypothetical protein
MVMLEMSFGFGGRERWSRDASTEVPVLGMEGHLPCHSSSWTTPPGQHFRPTAVFSVRTTSILIEFVVCTVTPPNRLNFSMLSAVGARRSLTPRFDGKAPHPADSYVMKFTERAHS